MSSNKKPHSPMLPEEEPRSIVFLDLEETVIDNWTDRNFLEDQIAVIERFVNGFSVSYGVDATGDEIVGSMPPIMNMKLGLMSWAVWDVKDKQNFNEFIRPQLEELLKRKFDDEFVWSMADWSRELFKFSNKLLSKDDMFDMFGKVEFLFALGRKHNDFKGKTIFLIDDAVEHLLTQRSPNNKSVVEIRNIYNMMRKK